MATMHYPSVALVIPCYNEAARIGQLVEGIKYFLASWHGTMQFVIVNDGSTDDSMTLLQEHAMIANLIKDNLLIIINQANLGKGAALKQGVKAATADFILTLDADMATSPLEIIEWATQNTNVFSGNHISIASRTHTNSSLVLISSRRQSGKVFNKLVRLITGLSFTDTQCGFKLYPAHLAKQLFSLLSTNGWAHDVELLLHAKYLNIPILEMPITWNERAASKINVITDGIKMLLDLIWIRIKFIGKK
jgi:dolichyl-phosphate beta-glucosyltransferase